MSPALIFNFVLASLYGLVFFLLFATQPSRLVLYWLVSVVGFFLGQLVASLIGLAIFNIGEARLVEGTLASWLCLAAAFAWARR